MAREIDERKKRKVLNRIRRARDAAERAIAKSDDPEAAEAAQRDLSDWEEEFVTSVEQRLNEYGSAFADPEKGALDEPLSRLQEMKLKEIEKKARGKGGAKPGFGRASSFKSRGSGFKSKLPSRPSSRDTHEDEEPQPAPPRERPRPALVCAADLAEETRPDDAPSRPRPAFKVIEGGKG